MRRTSHIDTLYLSGLSSGVSIALACRLVSLMFGLHAMPDLEHGVEKGVISSCSAVSEADAASCELYPSLDTSASSFSMIDLRRKMCMFT